ncbi:MAG TPA: GGDEF domain-containing protein [Terracidiphilus sp.]|nr:GGDEF domain-containing protein [Terracidiphilus sp.]
MAAAQDAPLTSLRAIRALSEAQVRTGIPVAFESTVTYYNRSDVDLFVEDGDDAIYVETQPNQDLRPGDRVLVRGTTRKSFHVDIVGDNIEVLHHGAVPTPVPADFEHLIRGEMDCQWVSIQAKIRSADTVNFGRGHGIYLRLLTDRGIIDAIVPGTDSRLEELLDAEVQVSGVVSGKFDSKMQLVGILLEVPDMADVKVLNRAPENVDSLPITPMADVLSAYSSNDRTSRVRVRGTITYYEPGSAAVLQNGTMSLWISTHSSDPMRIGDVADATGFPDARDGFLKLLDGEVRDTDVFDPVQPAAATWRQLSTWNSGDPGGHQSDLVSFEGEVVASIRAGSQDEFVLSSNGRLFTAIYRHRPGNRTMQAMKQIPTGTRIRVTGICMAEQPDSIDPTEQEVPFNILLRSFEDITVVTRAPIVNVRNLILFTAFLLLLLLAAGVRAWVTERNVRRQNANLAYIERARGRILEEINGSRPLADIIADITALVSLNLRDALCWCQIRDGAQLGNRPHLLDEYRVVQEIIAARSGPPHGTIYAAFHTSLKPNAVESEVLSRAAALASLAIETRRLYSDLVHRSDFDMLTDVHNRFSLEKYLDQQIEQSRQNAGIFGLLYIDLNEFKQVNDTYGHKIGDLYLQEIAMRLKHQLRAMDMLARIGGDEFAVLLANVRNRAEVEEVARRVERCVDGVFFIENSNIHGSASIGIAMYPDDAETKDAMLSAADAAMYVNKQIRREGG